MKLKEKYPEYYNIYDACVYIAFGYKTMSPELEILHKNLKNRIHPQARLEYKQFRECIQTAVNLLIDDAKEHTITLKGTVKDHSNTHIQIPIKQQSNVTNFLFDLPDQILCDGIIYTNVKIDLKSLEQLYAKPLYPYKPKKQKIKTDSLWQSGYTTPYIIIMAETISEEKINEKNQSKKEFLKKIISTKMEKYGLPKSDNLADAMATLIRLPKSQKGRSKK
ncbi:MAG: hypothetical protein KBT14_02060 [Proteobacteria bacterium]|nr:hypothetical protein [Candidatus Enterousia onthequi]